MTPDLIILSFFIYSFCGWFFESTVCSLYNEGCCINRGFFMGPVCPIYGAGALGSYLLLGSIEHPLLYFLISMCLSCAVEYLTAWALEKRFHARWWTTAICRSSFTGGSASTERCSLASPAVLSAFSLSLC